MFGRRMIHHERDRFHISRWREEPDVANLVPYSDREQVAPEAIRRAVTAAVDSGFALAYTAAMTPRQAKPFLAVGFEVHEELLLLQCQIAETPAIERSTAPTGSNRVLRRARRGDWGEVLAVDKLAFVGFWHFDRQAMGEAIRATPRHRFAVTRTDPVVGYHISGLAAQNLYVQRVAVHPDSQGEGWGTHLVEDALWWGLRNRAGRAFVNTQLHNHGAVALYERCGFEVADHRLVILHADLGELA